MATITTATGSVSAGAKEIIVTAASGVAVVVVLYWLLKKEVKDGAGAIADALAAAGKKVKDAAQVVNPGSDQNFVYQGSNKVVQLVTGDPDQTLGGAYYDGAQGLKKIITADQDNIINRGATAVVRGVTGDSSATLGTKIYDGVEWLKSVF